MYGPFLDMECVHSYGCVLSVSRLEVYIAMDVHWCAECVKMDVYVAMDVHWCAESVKYIAMGVY